MSKPPESTPHANPTTGRPTFDAKAFVTGLSAHPGVYRMLDCEHQVIYVGKARNLKKRVASYFNRTIHEARTVRMLAKVQGIEVTLTHTETEALLLESHQIKHFQPHYNVLLRDDKGYPYILITDSPFPRLTFHRGSRKGAGRFFGPYPSVGSTRENLHLLNKLFPLRQCEDSYFKHRSRPCLQFQIKRCSAPCVGKVDQAGYAIDVRHAILFLEGKSAAVIDALVKQMEQASSQLDFERAARYRDQIAALRKLQASQCIDKDHGDSDVIAITMKAGRACVQVFSIHDGRNLGNRAFFPKIPADTTAPEVIAAFIPQYYLQRPIPKEILLNLSLEDNTLLQQALQSQAKHPVQIHSQARAHRASWLRMAEENAEHALSAHLLSKASMSSRLEAVQAALDLAAPPTRIECFDISHTQGEATVGSCVVFDHEGPLKSAYRRYNIEGITPGDDYAAMQQTLKRRYARVLQQGASLPELILIDGGKAQAAIAQSVLAALQIESILVVGIAKGESRRPGLETLVILQRNQTIQLPAHSPALHLIQQIRDEAHRFAITSHRQRRARTRKHSVLEDIPGMGSKRRRKLLQQFGGLREVAQAGVKDLSRTPGISVALAQKIYDCFHS